MRYWLFLIFLGMAPASWAQDPSSNFDQTFMDSCTATTRAGLPPSMQESEKADGMMQSICKCVLMDLKDHFSGDELTELMRAGLLQSKPSPELAQKITTTTVQCVKKWVSENQT